MRQCFAAQPDIHLLPIEKIVLPRQGRDELPHILAGRQWLWTHPTLKAEIFALLEAQILAGKQATGRTGMDLWQILVLGVVRLGLDADWDRMEDLANHHLLLRQMLGCPPPRGVRTPKPSATKPCGTTSPCSMTNCCRKSTRPSRRPDARCSLKMTARHPRRWR
jgi:hypothetical protein